MTDVIADELPGTPQASAERAASILSPGVEPIARSECLDLQAVG